MPRKETIRNIAARSRTGVLLMRASVCSRRLLLVVAATWPVLVGACGGDERPRVRLATTTSARDTGLLDWVLPEAEKKEGYRFTVSVVAVGTGEALELAKRGDADFVIVHDRPREDTFLKEGFGTDRRDLMWNDFVLVGPAEDPAGIRGEKSAAAALRKIAQSKAGFVSRGDHSGTHSREKRLWAAGGGERPAWDGYKESGQGMGPTLLVTSERRAYTITDRGTLTSMRKQLELAVLVEGDPALVNPYGVMLVNPAKNPGVDTARARKVVDYLTSPEGQARIEAFRVGGEPIFHAGAPPR
jgi:tungstate transport system substrate-binding protein